MSQFNVIEVFKRIAAERCNDSFGWSVYTECYADEDILEDYGVCKDEKTLFEFMATMADIWEDKYQNARRHRGL